MNKAKKKITFKKIPFGKLKQNTTFLCWGKVMVKRPYTFMRDGVLFERNAHELLHKHKHHFIPEDEIVEV